MLQGNIVSVMGVQVTNLLTEHLFGGSKLQKVGAEFALAALGTVLSYMCNNRALSKVSSFIATGALEGLAYSSTEKVAEYLEEHDLETIGQVLVPALEVAAGYGLRKSASVATLDLFKYGSTSSVSAIPLEGQPRGYEIFDGSGGFATSIYKSLTNGVEAILSFGRSDKYDPYNLGAETFDAAGRGMMFQGVFKLCQNIYYYFTGADKVYGLSVYDVKAILKATSKGEMDKKDLKATAEKICFQLGQSQEYYNSFERLGRADKQAEIDIVAGIYNRTYGEELKKMYGSAITDPKILEKAVTLVEAQMHVKVTERLMTARKLAAAIKEFHEYGMPSSPNCQAAAKMKLDYEVQELKIINPEEIKSYKSLFSKAAVFETEYMMMLSILSQMESAETDSDFTL